MNQTLKICVSVQTAGTVDVPGTSTSFVPPSSAASWFCPVAAADRTDTLPVAPPARAKDRLRIRHPLSLRSIKRSVSALMDVPESLRMYSDKKVTAGRHCLQPHEKCCCLSWDITQNVQLELVEGVQYILKFFLCGSGELNRIYY